MTDIAWTTMKSPVGTITLVADEEGLRGLWLSGRERSMAGKRDNARLAPVRAQLEEYFTGERTDFDVPLSMHGTSVQLTVWDALRKIPYGETASYGEIAANIGQPGAARAVGSANGRNPVAIIVPCHRVIASGGKLGGYGGGLDRKQFLLDLERGSVRAEARPRA